MYTSCVHGSFPFLINEMIIYQKKNSLRSVTQTCVSWACPPSLFNAFEKKKMKEEIRFIDVFKLFLIQLA